MGNTQSLDPNRDIRHEDYDSSSSDSSSQKLRNRNRRINTSSRENQSRFEPASDGVRSSADETASLRSSVIHVHGRRPSQSAVGSSSGGGPGAISEQSFSYSRPELNSNDTVSTFQSGSSEYLDSRPTLGEGAGSGDHVMMAAVDVTDSLPPPPPSTATHKQRMTSSRGDLMNTVLMMTTMSSNPSERNYIGGKASVATKRRSNVVIPLRRHITIQEDPEVVPASSPEPSQSDPWNHMKGSGGSGSSNPTDEYGAQMSTTAEHPIVNVDGSAYSIQHPIPDRTSVRSSPVMFSEDISSLQLPEPLPAASHILTNRISKIRQSVRSEREYDGVSVAQGVINDGNTNFNITIEEGAKSSKDHYEETKRVAPVDESYFSDNRFRVLRTGPMSTTEQMGSTRHRDDDYNNDDNGDDDDDGDDRNHLHHREYNDDEKPTMQRSHCSWFNVFGLDWFHSCSKGPNAPPLDQKAVVDPAAFSGNVNKSKKDKSDKYISGFVERRRFLYGKYTGQLLHGLPDGVGICEYYDGSQYRGMWSFGQKEGQGVFIANDIAYEGDFQSDVANGTGRFVWPDGIEYQGEVVDGIPSGYGKYLFPDGDSFEGVIRNGKPWKEGRVISSDGATYEGSIRNGIRHGLGAFKDELGYIYEGNWKDGSVDGMGHAQYANGDQYEGIWKSGKRHGPGLYLYASGEKYLGIFAEGIPQGSGVFVHPNGACIRGHFNAASVAANNLKFEP